MDNDNDAKIIDVKRPGESPPDSTSRPIIVNRESMVKQDPMVAGAGSQPPAEEPLKHDGQSTERVLTPLSSEPPKETAAQPAPEAPVQPASEEQKAPEAEKPPANTTNDGSKEASAVSALAGQAQTKKEADKQSNLETEKAGERQKLIDSKKYFLPTGDAKRHRSRISMLIIFAVIVLGVIAVAFFLR